MPPLPINEPELTAERAPVKHDLYNLDSLISDLNTPKEQIQRTAPGSAHGQTMPGSSSDEYLDSPTVEPIPAEIAALSGKMIAGTIDTGLSTVFSLYAQSPVEKYEATDKQMDKLTQAWGAVAQKYNYRVEDSPWFNVLFLMVAVYFPIYKEAQKDHRFAEMANRIKETELKNQEIEARVKAMEATKAA
jgi:hypothetical protein